MHSTACYILSEWLLSLHTHDSKHAVEKVKEMENPLKIKEKFIRCPAF
jgi:hypothetical protein